MIVKDLIELLKSLPADHQVGRLQLVSSHQRGSTQPRFFPLKGVVVKQELFIRHDLRLPLTEAIVEIEFADKSVPLAVMSYDEEEHE